MSEETYKCDKAGVTKIEAQIPPALTRLTDGTAYLKVTFEDGFMAFITVPLRHVDEFIGRFRTGCSYPDCVERADTFVGGKRFCAVHALGGVP